MLLPLKVKNKVLIRQMISDYVVVFSALTFRTFQLDRQ